MSRIPQLFSLTPKEGSEGSSSHGNKGKQKATIQELMSAESNTNLEISYSRHSDLKKEIEQQRKMLSDAEKREKAQADALALGKNNLRVIDGLQAIKGTRIFLQSRPDWSGTILVQSSKEKDFNKKLKNLQDEFSGRVINFKKK
ncbi:uncharacterized protein LOC132603595 [Lycium barbarum]|uniref:uncharacterized protein LOC132603595 n=1 Tax=Lycium barbarum TaxID=112863 RepID=UPI00293ECE42|nr:uncharacterized protein LOC132603595 [Lycium barbarum]XP_060172704.1 uncharacterized protein LOC132603595 [Lycium barbarum]